MYICAAPLKRSAAAFPQIEDDVVELDQLRQEQPVAGKRQHDGSTARTTTTTTKESIEKVIAPPEAGSKEQQQQHLMPDLERQLEVATPLMSMSTTTTTSTSATTTTAAFKDEGERSQLEEPKTAAKPANEPGAHAKVKSHSLAQSRPIAIYVCMYAPCKPSQYVSFENPSVYPRNHPKTNRLSTVQRV